MIEFTGKWMGARLRKRDHTLLKAFRNVHSWKKIQSRRSCDREREILLHNRPGDGWQLTHTCKLKTPHWQCGQDSREERGLFDRENEFLARRWALAQPPFTKSGRGPSWARFQKEAEDRPTLLHTAHDKTRQVRQDEGKKNKQNL